MLSLYTDFLAAAEFNMFEEISIFISFRVNYFSL